MIKLGGLLLVIAVIFWLWSLFDALTADASKVRLLPKVVWVLLIVVFLPVLGPVAWVLVGRPRGGVRPAFPGGASFGPFGNPGPTSGGGRPVGPDDDPEFLRGI